MAEHALTFRTARREDLRAIVEMLADDALGREREQLGDPLPAAYGAAFDAIAADPNNELLVACRGDRVVATLQITYTPSLSYRGGWRATIESVRTAAPLRGQGIGRAFVTWAVERARARGCRLVQLTTHASRKDAHRFYERLGFRASHVGMKLDLDHAGEPAAPRAAGPEGGGHEP
ncbi:MAG TPA: GNAT family N-acetyltransferase [Longimicrobiales bacterium]